jgi:HSP20 family protein
MADQSVTRSQENRMPARWTGALVPFPGFQRELERLFGDFFSVFGPPLRSDAQGGQMPAGLVAPRIDLSESDTALQIKAELPGVDEKDVDVTLADDVLTIRGEIRSEHEEKKQDYHLMERARGTFVRSLRLPFSVDPNQVQAEFKDGVLSITIPKPKEVQDKAQRIELKRQESGNGGEGGQRAANAAASSNAASSSAENKVPETAAE